MSDQETREDVIRLSVKIDSLSDNMSELVKTVKIFAERAIRLEENRMSEERRLDRAENTISAYAERLTDVEREQSKRAWIVPLMTGIAILPAGAAVGALVKSMFG